MFLVVIVTVVMISPNTNTNILLFTKNSAFALDEDVQKLSSSTVRTTTEAFKVSDSSNA